MKPFLLCLHGWGGSKESFAELREALRGKDIEILTPDLPGFGSEPDPPTPWGIDEYAEWIEEWFRKNAPHPALSPSFAKAPAGRRGESESYYLLGHSLGGQIAVKLALRGNIPIHHLFLCAPAAIRPRFSLRRTAGYLIAKIGKVVLSLPGPHLLQPLLRPLLYKLMGVHDYERASSVMQRTMIRVTHEDLTAELPQLSLPVDLFWGTDDRLTPLWKGKRMHTLIPGNRLHIFQGKRHSIHRTCATEIAAIIRARIGIP